MSASETSTWELPDAEGGARRPTLDDVGGAELLDDDEPGAEPPKDGTELYAALCNQLQFQAYAAGRVIPSLRLTIAFAAGVPSVEQLEAASSSLLQSDLAIALEAVGQVTVEWTTTKLPPLGVEPLGCVSQQTVGAPGISVHRVPPSAPTRTKIRCRLFDGNTLANLRFSLHF